MKHPELSTSPSRTHAGRQMGAALLGAMLTVALVASLAASALWLHWRQVEVEITERTQAQIQWLLTGAFDWTRLILAEDARTSAQTDHLGEPWALPVQESKLSTFLSQDQQWREGDPEVYLSGHITDAQSRLNLSSLMVGDQVSSAEVAAWSRLFKRLDLPMSELQTLLRSWQQASVLTRSSANEASSASAPTEADNTPLLPQRIEQLGRLGLSTRTIARLQPYATLLPSPTPVNLNTAPLEVLEAVLPEVNPATLRTLLTQRNRQPWNTLQDVKTALGTAAGAIDERRHSVNSRHFEIRGRLRMGAYMREEVALVERVGVGAGTQVRMLWRTRGAGALPSWPSPSRDTVDTAAATPS